MTRFEVVVQRTVVEELIYRHVEADNFAEAESICLDMAKNDAWREKELVKEDYCIVFSDGEY